MAWLIFGPNLNGPKVGPALVTTTSDNMDEETKVVCHTPSVICYLIPPSDGEVVIFFDTVRLNGNCATTQWTQKNAPLLKSNSSS